MKNISMSLRYMVALLFLTVTVTAVETVTNIYPASGVVSTPISVIIIGTNFSGTPTVTIGSDTCSGVTVNSTTQITASVTPTAIGLKNVVVGGGSLTNGFAVVQSSTATVQVTITCSILQTLGLSWTANTTGKSEGATTAVAWSLLNLAAGTVRNTDSSAAPTDVIDFEVRNVGNGPAHVTITTANSTSSGATWTVSSTATATLDTFGLAVSNGANTASPTWLTVSTTPLQLNSGSTVATNAAAAFDLQFKAPTFDTTLLTQTITATITAAP